jgi:hypothetical protein
MEKGPCAFHTQGPFTDTIKGEKHMMLLLKGPTPFANDRFPLGWILFVPAGIRRIEAECHALKAGS